MSYSCSVPILMIFFNRPDSFAQVFEKSGRQGLKR